MSNENPYSAPEPADELLSADAPEMEEQEWEEEDEQEFEEEPIPYEYGSVPFRGLAKLIDLILFSAMFLLMFGFFTAVRQVVLDDLAYTEEVVEAYVDGEVVVYTVRRYPEVTGLQSFLSLLAVLLAGAVCEWFTGATPGKLLTGLRVVRKSEIATPSIASAIGRNIAMLFDGMFLGVPALFIMRTNPYKQRMGDVAAQTFVVRNSSIPAPLGVTPQDYILGMLSLFVGMGIYAFIVVMI